MNKTLILMSAAAAFSAQAMRQESQKRQPVAHNQTIEIRNDSNAPIWIGLQLDWQAAGPDMYRRGTQNLFQLQPGESFSLFHDISKEAGLYVWKDKPPTVFNPHNIEHGAFYAARANRLVFVRWDGNQLIPQNPEPGRVPAHNVKKDEIREMVG